MVGAPSTGGGLTRESFWVKTSVAAFMFQTRTTPLSPAVRTWGFWASETFNSGRICPSLTGTKDSMHSYVGTIRREVLVPRSQRIRTLSRPHLKGMEFVRRVRSTPLRLNFLRNGLVQRSEESHSGHDAKVALQGGRQLGSVEIPAANLAVH